MTEFTLQVAECSSTVTDISAKRCFLFSWYKKEEKTLNCQSITDRNYRNQLCRRINWLNIRMIKTKVIILLPKCSEYQEIVVQ